MAPYSQHNSPPLSLSDLPWMSLFQCLSLSKVPVKHNLDDAFGAVTPRKTRKVFISFGAMTPRKTTKVPISFASLASIYFRDWHRMDDLLPRLTDELQCLRWCYWSTKMQLPIAQVVHNVLWGWDPNRKRWQVLDSIFPRFQHMQPTWCSADSSKAPCHQLQPEPPTKANTYQEIQGQGSETLRCREGKQMLALALAGSHPFMA